ncbi:hypothetical protein [Bacillus haynesii]|nr:hypothetical protein [Bacillus haynesii]
MSDEVSKREQSLGLLYFTLSVANSAWSRQVNNNERALKNLRAIE